jgi:hypothetical protein
MYEADRLDGLTLASRGPDLADACHVGCEA